MSHILWNNNFETPVMRFNIIKAIGYVSIKSWMKTKVQKEFDPNTIERIVEPYFRQILFDPLEFD